MSQHFVRSAFDARLARCVPPHAIRPWPLPRVRSDAIEALRSKLSEVSIEDRSALVAGFRERLAAEGTPLVEPDEEEAAHCRITFVWFGEAPHGVVLQLNRLTDVRDPQDALLECIGESEVHALTLRLPRDWQGSYLFVLLPQPVAPNLHDPIDPRVIGAVARFAQTDPLARERIPSKAVAASAGQPLPDYAVARGDHATQAALWALGSLPTTELPPVRSSVSGTGLALHHWAAPGADERSAVILLLDGEVWHEQFPIAAELAERCSRGDLPPVHALFLDSGGPMQRELDYSGAPHESAALLEAISQSASGVVPSAPWIIAGQSFGGLFAALCAVRHPDRVRAAVAQSPSLWWPSPAHPWQSTRGWFEECAEAQEIAPVLLEAGTIDAGVVDRCRDATALLRVRGALIDYREHPAGHDVLEWQADLPDALASAIRATSA